MIASEIRVAGAYRYRRGLVTGAAAFLLVGLAAYNLGLSGRLHLPWLKAAILAPRAAAWFGVALWLAGAALLSAGLVAFGRIDLSVAKARPDRPVIPPLPVAVEPGRFWRDHGAWFRQTLRDHARYWRSRLDGDAWTGWLQAAAAAAVSLLGLLFVWTLWRRPPEAHLAQGAARVDGAILVVCAFPLLVLERTFAGIAPDRLPEAGAINRLIRVPLVGALTLGVGLVLTSAGLAWAPRLQEAVAVFLAVVALEMILRSGALIFMPFPPPIERRAVADSRVAGVVLRLGWPSWRKANLAIRGQFGIDLSRSWALSFLRRAVLPTLVGMALLVWLLTGVTALSVNQRGVYERFGAPAAVFDSGVHWHAPWPIGRVRPVENGVIHQLPIEFLLPSGDKGQAKEAPPVIVLAEARPSEESDRLWTGDHPFEGSYLIASEEAGRQSFQLVDTDMAVVYRIGRTDAAAMDAAYRLESPDELIQALSGQLLVRYFVQHRLLDILGESRERFAQKFQTQLQGELDALSSGLEVLSISIEAIHPPPGAAAAYHDVQAAEIRARAAVFHSRAAATNTIASAQQSAVRTLTGAAGSGAELVSQAKIEAVQFDADRQAYAKAGPVFLLERRLDTARKVFAKPRSTLILDHRLTGAQSPVLDLRAQGGPALSAEDPE